MGLVRYSRWASRLKTLNSQYKPFLSATSSFSSGTTAGNENPGRPGPPPIQVALTESSGRGVFATRKIENGELIHTAKPVLSHPSLSTVHRVCYFCLRKLRNTDTSQPQRVSFCSNDCKKQAEVGSSNFGLCAPSVRVFVGKKLLNLGCITVFFRVFMMLR